jgi:hypothetical protein
MSPPPVSWPYAENVPSGSGPRDRDGSGTNEPNDVDARGRRITDIAGLGEPGG